ncbi:MAG: hypothetical protein SWH61_12930 [Thermodesulfobacteriota bacterium]|nr:hypothetical protein [Thermodesulfobacteriota bacterium]
MVEGKITVDEELIQELMMAHDELIHSMDFITKARMHLVDDEQWTISITEAVLEQARQKNKRLWRQIEDELPTTDIPIHDATLQMLDEIMAAAPTGGQTESYQCMITAMIFASWHRHFGEKDINSVEDAGKVVKERFEGQPQGAA